MVWLNGQEIWRTNLPAGPILFTNLATAVLHTTDGPYIYNPIAVDPSLLSSGTNVIAVEVHQYSAAFSRLGFDMELIGTGVPAVAPVLSLSLVGTNLIFTWPAGSGAGFGLYATTNLSRAAWGAAGSTPQTNGDQLVVTQACGLGAQFFQLRKN